VSSLGVGPGERYDVIIDFSGGLVCVLAYRVYGAHMRAMVAFLQQPLVRERGGSQRDIHG
jgi:FtsP/CotA-like multicopper oxidase with cupredoxin domain